MHSAGKINSNNNLADEIRHEINRKISELIKTLPAVSPLSEAVKYVLQSGGKRTRPLILLSIISDYELDFKNYLSSAAAIELLHISSLVHDDLPAIDNDTQRRGVNTCHVEFNEATAVLTGDLLIALAFRELTAFESGIGSGGTILAKLSEAFIHLCCGQQLDLNDTVNVNEKLNVAAFKTGALFSAAVNIPFLINKEPEKLIKVSEDLGLQIGILFQVCDDIADQYESSELKGRDESSDRRNNKLQFFFKNEEKTEQLILQIYNDIKSKIEFLENNSEKKIKLINFKDAVNSLFEPFECMKFIF